jgi:hypothetical protein
MGLFQEVKEFRFGHRVNSYCLRPLNGGVKEQALELLNVVKHTKKAALNRVRES